MNEVLPKNLKFLREKAGLKQKECGFNQTTWNNYETGYSSPKADDLIKISKFFGVSLDKLLKEDLAEKVVYIVSEPEVKYEGLKEPLTEQERIERLEQLVEGIYRLLGNYFKNDNFDKKK